MEQVLILPLLPQWLKRSNDMTGTHSHHFLFLSFTDARKTSVLAWTTDAFLHTARSWGTDDSCSVT
jgi:hypothetical protein